MSDAQEWIDQFRRRHRTAKKPRINWKHELAEERAKTLKEVRAALIAHKRSIPRDWERAYMAAVSVVEHINNQSERDERQ